MAEANRIYGKSLPETIDPPERVCFVIEIPDTLQYRAALLGQLEWLADWRCWQHTQADYPNPPPDNVEAAELFAIAVTDGRFDECGVMSCDDVTDCIENDPGTRAAVGGALTDLGFGVPGEPLSTSAASRDTLPGNVKDLEGNCIDDNLWGAMLYVVQSGNRVITDFFEVIEVATNTLENMEIVSKVIPAAGDYISAAAGFADQLAESLQEGYSGAYTEAYEQSLACSLFCLAKESCSLSVDDMVAVLNSRLTAPLDLADFGEIMAGVATGTWVGDEIADVMFLIYFSALKFGQQFGDQIGIRPLEVIMSLGADQLASDNWMVLCECAEEPQLQIYNQAPNFGGTLRDTISFESGVPFVLEAINFDTVRYGMFIEAPDGNWTLEYTISPDPVMPTNPGEVTWIYVNTSGAAQAQVGPNPASNMPTPVDTMHVQNSAIYGCGWESFEAFTLTITLTAI